MIAAREQAVLDARSCSTCSCPAASDTRMQEVLRLLNPDEGGRLRIIAQRGFELLNPETRGKCWTDWHLIFIAERSGLLRRRERPVILIKTWYKADPANCCICANFAANAALSLVRQRTPPRSSPISATAWPSPRGIAPWRSIVTLGSIVIRNAK
jgi:hypothetical protein